MRIRFRSGVAGLCVMCLLVCLPLVASGQAGAPRPPAGAPVATGVLAGRVVDARGNSPVTHAIVTVNGGGQTRRVRVDGQGRFVFTRMPAATFTMTVTARGYLVSAHGQQRADGAGRPIALTEGERIQDVTVRIWPAAAISGTVVDDVGEAAGATVQAWKRAMSGGHWRFVYTGATATTDERGRYRISGLTPGEYTLVITSLTTTIPSAFQRVAASLRAMDEPARDELARMAGTNGTAGYISDLQQGVATTRVGELLLQGATGPTSTDGSSVDVFPTVWYPNSPTPAGAGVISLAPGEEHTGADLRLTLTPTKRISGTVIGPDGPVPWLALRLVPAGLDDVAAEVSTSLSQSFNTAMVATDDTGAFTILGVPPGQYVLRALTTPRPLPEPPAPATSIRTADGMTQNVQAAGPRLPPLLSREPTWWTATPVTVGEQNITDLVVSMRPGMRVNGRVEFEGSTERPQGNALRAVRVSLEPADGRTIWHPTTYQAQINAEGEFYSSGMTAGRYFVRVDTPPQGWTLKSAIVGGRDISVSPVELDAADVNGLVVTFTDQPSVVSGTVRTDQAQPDDDAAVIVFPREGPWTNLGTRPRQVRLVRPTRAGAFTIRGLPPGAYAIVAVSDAEVTHWQSPAFLKSLLRHASSVTVTDKGAATIDLVTAVLR